MINFDNIEKDAKDDAAACKEGESDGGPAKQSSASDDVKTGSNGNADGDKKASTGGVAAAPACGDGRPGARRAG